MAFDHGLLDPGRQRAVGITSDAAIVRAMLTVESAWVQALADEGVLPSRTAEAIGAAAQGLDPDVGELAQEAEIIGNAVLPVVQRIRAAVAEPKVAAAVHTGLTSQDVVDTALMLVSAAALERIADDLRATATTLVALATEHRDTVLTGRTLTQPAVPITFGLKAAQWLHGVLDVLDQVDQTRTELPVQAGGAAGTLSRVAAFCDDPLSVVNRFAQILHLEAPAAPWHTRRTPITRIADACIGVTDLAATVAANTALMSRPELGEVREGGDAGRGGSSTMPGKRNPVLSVLLRSTGMQAPALAASVHLSCAAMVDERPDGAWHAEWAPLRRLLTLALTAASQLRELLSDLEVDPRAMAANAARQRATLLAEAFGGAASVPDDARVEDHLGVTPQLVDAALERAARVTGNATPSSPPLPALSLTRLAGAARSGPMLIVGAGLGTWAATMWQEAAFQLADQYEVIGVDLPGHGHSPTAASGFSVADVAASLKQSIEGIADPGRPVYYAGVSLAGAIAYELALDPGPFEAVAAIASASQLGQGNAWRQRAELVREAGTSVMVAGSVQRWFAPGFTDTNPEVVGKMLHNLSDTDDHGYAQCCEALADYDVTSRLPDIKVPLLLAPGALDTVVTTEQVNADADATQAITVVEISGVAHQPPVEDPEQIITALQQFFADVREGR